MLNLLKIPLRAVSNIFSAQNQLYSPIYTKYNNQFLPATYKLAVREFHIKRRRNKNRRPPEKYKLKTHRYVHIYMYIIHYYILFIIIPYNLLFPHRATAKRFWVTGAKRVFRFPSGKSHRMRNKTSLQLHHLTKPKEIPAMYYRKIRRSLPYAW